MTTGQTGGDKWNGSEFGTATRPVERVLDPLGKLPGSVWTIPSQPLTVPPSLGIVTIAPSREMRAAVLHAAGLADLTILPVIRLALPGIPAQCPHCHADVAFPLTVFGNQVQASCPACFLAVAQIAVTSA